MTQPLRVLALTHTAISESCTFVRSLTPLQALRSMGLVEYELLHLMPWNVGAIRHTLRTLDQWDLIWISRPRHYFMLPIIRAARQLSKPVLVDIDDWLLDVPADHVDADFYRMRPRRETIRTALRAADAITTSTHVIADRCAALGTRVHILPNAIDTTQFVRLPRAEHAPLAVAFCGTPSHQDDVPLIAPALRRLLSERQDRVRVISVGCPIPDLAGAEGYTHHDFIDAPLYPRFLSELRIDVGLAPLQDTLFNAAKSDIKYLEYAATGAATIASPVTPYLAAIRPDRGVIVDANTPALWTAALHDMIAEAPGREHLAARAYEWVRAERSIEVTAMKWYTLFRQYVDEPGMRTAPGTRQLDPGVFERVMVNIMVRQTPYDMRQLQRRFIESHR